MDALTTETRIFRRRLEEERKVGRARAALQLLCGIDLDDVAAAGEAGRVQAAARVRRRLERERLKGLRLHWSYDLDRHIALKQALDMLGASATGPQDKSGRRSDRA
jgi:hypothetical protein